jgi:hypothetical protein
MPLAAWSRRRRKAIKVRWGQMRWGKYTILAALAVQSFAVNASTVTNRHVTGFIINGSSALVYFDGAANGSTCGDTDRYVFDSTTGVGQSSLSLLMTLYSLARIVTIVGSGSCSGSTETIAQLRSDGR